MKIGLTIVVAFVCGFAGAELFHIWSETPEQRPAPPRPFAQVLDDVEHAIPQLVGVGVYWFDGSPEDARQIKDIVELIQPDLNTAIMKIEGVSDVAVINSRHAIFRNGEMLLREAEQKLLQLAPES